MSCIPSSKRRSRTVRDTKTVHATSDGQGSISRDNGAVYDPPPTPWESLVNTSIQTLNPRDQKLIETFGAEMRFGHEGIKKGMEELDRKYSGSRTLKFQESLRSTLEHTASFGRVVDTMVQANPQIAALVWGGVRLIIEICVRPLKVHDLILEMTRKISLYSSHFEDWRRAFPHAENKRLTVAIQKTCITFFAFLVDAISFLRRHPIVNTLRVLFVPGFEAKFKHHEDEIMRETKEVRMELQTAGFTSTATKLNELKELLRAPRAPPTLAWNPDKPFRWIQNCARNKFFFSRQHELDQVEKHLEQGLDPTSRNGISSVVIHGLGGLGKTSVAMEYMYRHYDDYKVILWLYADTLSKLNRDFKSIAGTLKLEVEPAFPTPADAVLYWINHLESSWLVVFDNADHMPMITPFWPAANHGSIIVTSRSPISNNISFAAAGVHIKPFSTTEGADFLLSHLEDFRPFSAEEERSAQKISESYDGLALGLRQAAAFMSSKRCLPSAFVTLYETHSEMIESTKVPGHYSKTVSNVWEMSLSTLSRDAVTLLNILSFLDPDAVPTDLFTHLQSTFVSQIGHLDAIESLADQSLIDVNVHEKTIKIHRFLQKIIRRRLERSGDDVEAIYDVTVDAVCGTIPEDDFLSMQHLDAWEMSALYLSHADFLHRRLSLNASEHARNALIVLLGKVATYYQETGHYDACESIIEKAKEVGRANGGDGVDNLCLSRVYYYQGRCYLETNRPAEALESFKQALSLFERRPPENPSDAEQIYVSVLVENLGMTCIANELFDEAETHLKQCIEAAKRPGSKVDVVMGDFMQCLGACYLWKGELGLAEECLRRAILLPCGRNNENYGGALYSLGNTYLKQRRYAEAFEAHTEVMDLYVKDLGPYHPWVADSFHKVGSILNEADFAGRDPVQAEALLRRAVEIYNVDGQKGTRRSKDCEARSGWKLSQILFGMDPHSAEAKELWHQVAEYMSTEKGRKLEGTPAVDEVILDGLVLYWAR